MSNSLSLNKRIDMKKLSVVIPVVFILASMPTFADIYIGAKGGKSWLSESCTSPQGCDDENVTVGAFVGYEAWDFLSIEAGYDYLGKFIATGLEKETGIAITLAPKLNLSLTDDANLYGKFGGAFVKYGNQEDYSYLGAVGLELQTDDNMAVRLEYQHISDISNDIFGASGHSATIGFVYKFGGNEELAPLVIVEKAQVKPVITMETFKTQKLSSSGFKSSSAALTEGSKESLTQLVNILNAYPQANVQITGYTDSTGSASYNHLLSEERAISVGNELVKSGVDVSRVLIDGQGENNPIASNSTKEGREQNRRVEMTIPKFDYQVQK
jgi:OOP family OmpA-OmpF porin